MKKTAWIYTLLLVAIIIGTFFIAGATIMTWVDIPTFLYVIIASYLASAISHGITGIIAAYKVALHPDTDTSPEAIKKSIAVFKGLSRNLITMSIAAVLMGTIAMLTVVSDTESFARGLAVATLSFFYAAIALVLFVYPFRARLEEALGSNS